VKTLISGPTLITNGFFAGLHTDLTPLSFQRGRNTRRQRRRMGEEDRTAFESLGFARARSPFLPRYAHSPRLSPRQSNVHGSILHERELRVILGAPRLPPPPGRGVSLKPGSFGGSRSRRSVSIYVRESVLLVSSRGGGERGEVEYRIPDEI